MGPVLGSRGMFLRMPMQYFESIIKLFSFTYKPTSQMQNDRGVDTTRRV